MQLVLRDWGRKAEEERDGWVVEWRNGREGKRWREEGGGTEEWRKEEGKIKMNSQEKQKHFV